MGVIGCMWLGARRAGHALLSALAYPAMGLLLVTLMLAYSRGALVALALGLVLWFCIVPLRLRGAAVLLAGALGAAVVVAWDFSRHALSAEGIALAQRVTAGHQLGVLLVAMLVAAHARRARDRLLDRPAGALSAGCAGAPERPARDSRAGRGRRSPAALARQPPRAHRQHLPRVQLAHQPERQGRRTRRVA